MTVVFVALPFERRAVLRACPGIVREDVGRVLSWCVGAEHRVVECGLGLAAASRGVDAILQVMRPKALFSVGCAGGLDPSLVAGDVVLADTVVDAGEPSGGSIEPGLDEMAARLGERGVSARRGRIASASNIVATPGAKGRLFARTRALVVDMESASIARAANTAGIPFYGIRIVLDDARTEIPASVEDERFRRLPFAVVAERLESVGAALFRGTKTDFSDP